MAPGRTFVSYLLLPLAPPGFVSLRCGARSQMALTELEIERQLTGGAVPRIFNGEIGFSPTLQLIDFKRIGDPPTTSAPTATGLLSPTATP